MRLNRFRINLLSALVLLLGLLGGCMDDENITDSGDNEPDPPDDTEITQGDGQLEAVTWNIEWYGVEANGPADEALQTENILQVLDSLNADLYAFQEVQNAEALSRIVDGMVGYSGFVADFIPQAQRTAFVFNTETIDSLSSGAITQDQSDFDWASGRFPFFFSFNYQFEDVSTPIFAVVIHAKAFDDKESYERRKRAAESLHEYFMSTQPESSIIFLGDYNDDVDVSIYNDETTPYQVFVNDTQNFRVVTKSLSDKGISSTVNFPDMIDHITISDELFDRYIQDSEQSYTIVESFITDYGTTTSDHYPVWVKFDFSEK